MVTARRECTILFSLDLPGYECAAARAEEDHSFAIGAGNECGEVGAARPVRPACDLLAGIAMPCLTACQRRDTAFLGDNSLMTCVTNARLELTNH